MVGKEKPTEDEVRNIEAMDLEFRQNETRHRAALICEDTERRDAGRELETRSGNEWAGMVAAFEVRQVIGALNEAGHCRAALPKWCRSCATRAATRAFPCR